MLPVETDCDDDDDDDGDDDVVYDGDVDDGNYDDEVNNDDDEVDDDDVDCDDDYDGDGDGDDNNFVHFDSVEIFWGRLHQTSYLSIFSTSVLLGSIFLHMKVRKLWQNLSKISQNFST